MEAHVRLEDGPELNVPGSSTRTVSLPIPPALADTVASPRRAGAAIPGLVKWIGNIGMGNHDAVAVTSFDEPSEYSAMAM